MRQFFLEDENGERWTLQAYTSFLHEPDGLGFEDDYSFVTSNSGFFHVTAQTAEQPNIGGDIVFFENCYQSYENFTNWAISKKQLKLIYRPQMEDYYMDVVLTSVGKSEITPAGYLSCPINLDGLSPWYRRNPLSFPLANAPAVNYKKYSYQYSYMYALSAIPYTVDFTNKGHFPARLYLDAMGALVSPALTVTVQGEILGKLDLTGTTINDGERLIFSTLENDAGVWRLANGVRTSLIDAVELTAGVPIFVKIPINTPVVVTLSAAVPIENPATLQIYEFFKTR